MKKLFFVLTLLTAIFFTNPIIAQNCNYLPKKFNSYSQALKEVRKADFKINDWQNTSSSSWIRGAYFYSCDGLKGYLIIESDNKNYIHANVPLNVWRQFKLANSFGSFYANNIRGRYLLPLN
ncbi:MAG: KTSC domain-containing protein [Bacteroidia bacterium]|nr:KTSC domain-containing protein [Bacteroidia bacterium]MCF8446341.1 KTSC domain-containing protein [Bacteroidia bacterium]